MQLNRSIPNLRAADTITRSRVHSLGLLSSRTFSLLTRSAALTGMNSLFKFLLTSTLLALKFVAEHGICSSYPWLAKQHDVLLCLTLQWSHFQYRPGIGLWNWPGILRLSLASQSLDWTSFHSSMLCSIFQPLITLAKMIHTTFSQTSSPFYSSLLNRSPFNMHPKSWWFRFFGLVRRQLWRYISPKRVW